MTRSTRVFLALAAVVLGVVGFSCERGPSEPAVEYLPIEGMQ